MTGIAAAVFRGLRTLVEMSWIWLTPGIDGGVAERGFPGPRIVPERKTIW